MVDDRLFVNGLFVPDSLWKMKQKLQEVLQPRLPPVLGKVVADYLGIYAAAAPNSFQERLYGELHAGNTRMLQECLYDMEKDELREHPFWDHLRNARHSTRLVFVYMVLRCASASSASSPKGIAKLADLIFQRVPQAKHFLDCYTKRFDLELMILNHVGLDEWPQVWKNDQDHWQSKSTIDRKIRALAVHFLLGHEQLPQLEKWIKKSYIGEEHWFVVFSLLHAAKGALLSTFFHTGLDSFMDGAI